MARMFKKEDKIRLLSIGTGEKEFDGWDSVEDFNTASFMMSLSEFMMNMDVYTADFYLKNQFAFDHDAQDYLRLQTISNLGMDKVD
mmetsp:Transcript_6791/g.10940  ORF Transcript_6791/g.10940 Transcript_6791/m.10940 type:complete len:86 (-) Transcript_6791:132-389(-)